MDRWTGIRDIATTLADICVPSGNQNMKHAQRSFVDARHCYMGMATISPDTTLAGRCFKTSVMPLSKIPRELV